MPFSDVIVIPYFTDLSQAAFASGIKAPRKKHDFQNDVICRALLRQSHQIDSWYDGGLLISYVRNEPPLIAVVIVVR